MTLKLEQHPAGVDYKSLDYFKFLAAQAARQTAGFIHPDWEVVMWTYGLSAFAIKHKLTGIIIVCVNEGIGTKPLVAIDPNLHTAFRRTYQEWIAQCNISASYNDLITIGAVPLFFMPHAALAEGSYLGGENADDHIRGTYETMRECRTAWGGGETSELQKIICPGTMALSGCAVGFAASENALINPANIRPGQRILFLKSTGIHINGLSAARAAVANLSDKYLTLVPGTGQTIGEALLQPTRLYVSFMAECARRGTRIAFAANVSGHGITKVGRAPGEFTYRITEIFKAPPVLDFLQIMSRKSIRDAYKAWNMGMGFLIIVEPQYVALAQEAAAASGDELIDGGVVEEGVRQVIVEPIGETYDAAELMSI